MGRVPKYRAWDKKRNEMVEVSILDFDMYDEYPHGYIIVADGYEWNKDPETINPGSNPTYIASADCLNMLKSHYSSPK